MFAQAAQRDIKAEALARFETDPNIRLVISCTHEDGAEALTLPMSERDCAAACSRLEDYGESAVLKIEACRYNRPWNEIFGTVLQDEGLYRESLAEYYQDRAETYRALDKVALAEEDERKAQVLSAIAEH